jgi:hypothetical protein
MCGDTLRRTPSPCCSCGTESESRPGTRGHEATHTHFQVRLLSGVLCRYFRCGLLPRTVESFRRSKHTGRRRPRRRHSDRVGSSHAVFPCVRPDWTPSTAASIRVGTCVVPRRRSQAVGQLPAFDARMRARRLVVLPGVPLRISPSYCRVKSTDLVAS